MVGGPENGTVRLVRGFAEAGTRVTVVAPAFLGERPTADPVDGVEVVFVPHDRRLSLLRGMRPWREAALQRVGEVEPDVVHGQGILTGGVVAAATDRPRLVTARGNARRDTLAAYRGVTGRVRAAMRDRLARGVVDAVDVLVGVHPDWRVNLPVQPRRLEYIPNIVDEAFFSVARKPAARTVLYCGGPRRIKGWDLLQSAFEGVLHELPDAQLHAVGWPIDADRPNVPGVQVSAPLSPHELARAMAASDVVVLPSRYDVSPILLAEAWATGTPVIATTAGGLAALAPGAAVVVPPESPPALAQAMLAVLRGEIDTSELVRVGFERAAQHRGGSVVEAHLALYAELAG